jgi:hypothetical protein
LPSSLDADSPSLEDSKPLPRYHVTALGVE